MVLLAVNIFHFFSFSFLFFYSIVERFSEHGVFDSGGSKV